MKHLKTFEELDIEFDDFDWIQEEDGEPLVLNKELRGKKVICIKDCDIHHDVNMRWVSSVSKPKYSKPIKKGEIKVVSSFSTKVWFTDTPDGWGAYDKENFVMA